MGACNSVTSHMASDAILSKADNQAPSGPRLVRQTKLEAVDAASDRSTALFSDTPLPRKGSGDQSDNICSPKSIKPTLTLEVFFLRQGDIVYKVPVISQNIQESSLLKRRNQLALRTDSLQRNEPQLPKKGLRPKASTFSHPKKSSPQGLNFK